MNKKTTAIYARVSTNKNTQVKGLESQVRALKKYCKNNGIDSFSLYDDFGFSGSKASRPGLDKMIADCRAGKINAVVVYSFSRFARSTSHLLSALDEFRELGIDFVSLSENIQTNSPMGKAVFVILAAISELERQLISERVQNGLINAREKGKQIGRPKTVNEVLVRELLLQNYTYEKIANLANCGISSVGRIARSMIGQN